MTAQAVAVAVVAAAQGRNRVVLPAVARDWLGNPVRAAIRGAVVVVGEGVVVIEE